MNWEEANNNGLIAPYLLQFNHDINTLMPSYNISPYKGYWVYLYEEVDINFESKVQIEEDIDENLSQLEISLLESDVAMEVIDKIKLNLKEKRFGCNHYPKHKRL